VADSHRVIVRWDSSSSHLNYIKWCDTYQVTIERAVVNRFDLESSRS